MAQREKILEGWVIHWLTSDRFDTKPDKSSWTEVGDSLASQGARVNVITSFSKKAYYPDALKVNMVYLKSINLPLIYRVAFTFFAFAWLLKHASRNDVVMLNQHELWIAPLLKLAGFKKIHLDIRTLPVIGGSLKDKLDVLLFWKLVMKLFAKSCHSHSFITQRLLTAVEDEFNLSFPDHVIWQSGVNADFFTKTLKNAAATTSTEAPFTLFYHGSLYERRGVNRVVDAFAHLPEAILNQSRFVIVGNGSGLDGLIEQVKSLGLEDRIELKGFVPYEKIPLEIAQADFCICPLPNYPEWNVSSPLKVLEYMACAKPMILTPIPAHTDVLDGQEFVVWTEGDSMADILKAIKASFEGVDKYKNAAKKAPQIIAKQWDWQAHGQRLGQYLKKSY